MAETALKLVLLGDDRTASKALKGVGTQAGVTHGKLDRLKGGAKVAGAAIAGGLVLAGAAAVDFGADALKAFADADKSQKQLEDAYRRFPKVQNVSIEALRKYNQELQRKTGADADDLAASQATLAAFKLNGRQIKAMSPLLVDYANKTGKTLPDAAKLLGKATLGNTRALKDLGISYKSTGDPAKDYANIMKLLQEKVGGYTESLPEAERKSKILSATFGDLQEAVGEKLQPAMLGLMDAGQGVLDWLDQNPKVVQGANAAWGLFSTGLAGLWDIIRKFVLPGLAMLNEYGIRPVVQGLAALLDWMASIPGAPAWIKDSAVKLGEVDEMIGAIDEGLSSMAEDPPVIDLDTKNAETKAKKIDDRIIDLSKKRLKLKSEGDTKGVDAIDRKIKALEKKKHQVLVGVGLKRSGYQKATINVTSGGGGGRAQIRMNASGHPSFPGGLTWIGEGMGHSPELVSLPTGSRILSTGQSRAAQSQMATSPGGGMFVQQITVKGDTNPNAAARRINRLTAQTKVAYGPGWRPVKGGR